MTNDEHNPDPMDDMGHVLLYSHKSQPAIAPERWRNLAINLENALADACAQLQERDLLIAKIRSYPYIPQGIVALIEEEMS